MRRRLIRPIVLALVSAMALGLLPAARLLAAQDGSEARQLFAIIYRAGPAWKAGRPMAEQDLAAHGAYMKRLFDEGHSYAAGPLGAESGLVLIYAKDLAEVQQYVREDPAVKGGIFVGEVNRYAPRFLSPLPLKDTK